MVPYVLIEEIVQRADISSSCIYQTFYPLKAPWYTSGFE